MFVTLSSVILVSCSGGLLSESGPEVRHARFIDSPVSFAGSTVVGAAPRRPLEMMSLPELEAELQYELDNRRSLVAPIVLLGAGVAALVTASILPYVLVTTSMGVAVTYTLLVGALLLGGIALGVVGTVLLISGIVRNAKSSQHVRRIEARIEQLRAIPQQQYYPPQPQPYYPPQQDPGLPPPPPPPQGMSVVPQVLLATF